MIILIITMGHGSQLDKGEGENGKEKINESQMPVSWKHCWNLAIN